MKRTLRFHQREGRPTGWPFSILGSFDRAVRRQAHIEIIVDRHHHLIEFVLEKVIGARDFVVLPVTHASIKRDSTAMEYTLRFLQHGYFKSEAERQPLPDRE